MKKSELKKIIRELITEANTGWSDPVVAYVDKTFPKLKLWSAKEQRDVAYFKFEFANEKILQKVADKIERKFNYDSFVHDKNTLQVNPYS